MKRPLSYLLSLIFLIGFFWFDYRFDSYNEAIPYFGAVLFSFWSPKRIDILIVAALCFGCTILGGFVSDNSLSSTRSLDEIMVERGLSMFALVCVTFVGWQRRAISLRLQEANARLEERVSTTKKQANEIQDRLSLVASELDQHTVDRRQREREFQETIASYQTLIESLPLNVFQKNFNSEFTYANARFLNTVGKTKAECIGKTDFDLFPDALAEKYAADDQRVLEANAPLEQVEEHVRPDGKKIYVQVLKAPIHDSNDEIIGLQGMFWDVTDRIEAEQRQAESDQRFRHLVNSNIIGIFTGNLDGRIIEANDEFLSMLGYSRAFFRSNGLKWNELTPSEFDEVDKKMESSVRATGYCRPLEKEYIHADGHRVPVLVGAVRLGPEKDIAICSVVDITSQKEAERALKSAKDAADEANRSKSLFLANMSHEIRTPLNAIIGMTNLVIQSNISREQREYLNMVNDSGEALLDIINDILDFSKVQAGKLQLEPVEFSLRTRIGDALRPLSIRAHQKDLKIVCDVAGEVPDTLYGDPVCLRQVLTNLVNNAVKFTERGEIVVTVTVAEDDQPTKTDGVKRTKLHFAVNDTGPGISPDIQDKIFRAFEQADNTATRKFGGTGLGLAICTNLVELMEGSVWVESELGKGSTFHFTGVWEVRKDREPEASLPSPFQSPLEILLIDEHRRSLKVLEDVLKRWDIRAESYYDFQDGLEAFQKTPTRFQVLVIDEATVRNIEASVLKQFRLGNPNLRIVSLSSDLSKKLHSEDSPRKALNVEVSLLKPVQESELFDAISEVVSNTKQAQPEFDDSEPHIPPIKILLAEDNLVNQRLAIAILTQREHEVHVANNGAEAFEMAKQDDFDLILMDIQMPEVDGLQATKMIREHELNFDGRTSIIALTAHAGESDRQRCLDAGMDGYLTKPLRPQELMLEIKRLVKKGDTAIIEELANDDNNQENVARSIVSDSVNWEQALEQTANDEELLLELIQIFKTESPLIIEQLESGVKEKDFQKISAKAHHLKASFRVFSCPLALELSESLERMSPQDDPQPIFDKLKSEYQVICDELSRRQ